MKKNNKFILAILLAIVLACVLVACSNADKKTGEMVTVTEAVTDEAGEVVTDAQGEVVTEAVDAEVQTTDGGEAVTEVVTNQKKEPYTHKDGSKVTRAVVIKTTSPFRKTTSKQNDDTTTKKRTTTTKKGDTTTKNDKTTTTTTTKKGQTTTAVKQPNAPGKVTGFKVDSAEKDSVKLVWNKLDCDGYEIRYSTDGENWTQVLTTKTSATVSKLTSYTKYIFQIRGYNEYSGSKIATNNWVEVKGATEADTNNERQLKLTCMLPATGTADTLTIYVKKDGSKKYVKDSTISIDSCDGMKHSYKTKEKYKGLVQIKVILKNADVSAESELTDKNSVSLDLTNTNIGIAQGVDD